MLPEKSELRERLEASILPTCPECNSKDTQVFTLPDHSEVSCYRCNGCKVIFYTEKIAK